MATAVAIINRAYALIGMKDATDALNADDAAYGLAALNSLIDSWNTQNLFIVSETEAIATVSAQTATIGAGMVFNVTRPVSIRAGAFARVSGVDYPLTQVDAQQFAAIPAKTTNSTYPDFFYYQPGLPTGLVYFYPIPTGAEIHLPVNVYLTAFADLTTNYTLAPGYQRALEFSLAEELAPGIRQLDKKIAQSAMGARKAIRRSNVVVPMLATDVPQTPFGYYLGS